MHVVLRTALFEPHKLSRKNKGLFIIVYLVIVSGLIACGNLMSEAHADSLRTWNELKTKSKAHELIVTAYKDCRGADNIFSTSISECHLFASQYAQMRGLSKDFPLVLSDIEGAVKALKERNMQRWIP